MPVRNLKKSEGTGKPGSDLKFLKDFFPSGIGGWMRLCERITKWDRSESGSIHFYLLSISIELKNLFVNRWKRLGGYYGYTAEGKEYSEV